MIAVIMSTYNGEKYLPQQLDSVLRQTLEDFILIIRDDGSSDGTVPLLRGYTDERRPVPQLCPPAAGGCAPRRTAGLLL